MRAPKNIILIDSYSTLNLSGQRHQILNLISNSVKKHIVKREFLVLRSALNHIAMFFQEKKVI